MATATTARSTIPAGETLHNVEWATYCKLRDDPANDHLRMTYLDGELTIASPRQVYGIDSRGIMIVVMAIARAYRIRFMAVGMTTLRKEGRGPLQGAGKEPDEGFFLGDDVARVRGKTVLDLAIDPPPTLALEVDNTANSEAALPAYARIGVPEVWRFDVTERTLWFGRLDGDHYEEIHRSLGLPRLTPSLVLQALEARMTSTGSTGSTGGSGNSPRRIEGDRDFPRQRTARGGTGRTARRQGGSSPPVDDRTGRE